MRKTIGGLIVLTVALSGCGGNGDKKKSVDPLQRDTAVVKAAWTVDLDPIGQPVVAGNTAVVIAKDTGKRLKIVGVDTANGSIAWSYPVSPNEVVAGIARIPQLTKNASGQQRVVFYRPKKKPDASSQAGLRTPIVAVDPAS